MCIPTRMLPHKQVKYKEMATRHWDVAPKHPDLDASSVQISLVPIETANRTCIVQLLGMSLALLVILMNQLMVSM